MPTPRDNEPRDEFIQRCIPMVIDEGTAQTPEQAYAICVSFYDNADKEIITQEFLQSILEKLDIKTH